MLRLIVNLLLVWFSSVLALTILVLSAYNLVSLPQKRCFTWKGHSNPHFSVHVYCGQTVAHLGYCWALVGGCCMKWSWRSVMVLWSHRCSLFLWRCRGTKRVSFLTAAFELQDSSKVSCESWTHFVDPLLWTLTGWHCWQGYIGSYSFVAVSVL